MSVVPHLSCFRRIVLLWLAVAVACIPAVAASIGESPLPNSPRSGVHAGLNLAPLANDALRDVSFAFTSSGSASEDDSEEILSVESFSSALQLISDGLPLPLSSSIELHCSSIFRVLTGHDDVSHLRGPPSSLFM